MKKMADIMEELGFRPEASNEVKKAFIKNLIKEAHSSEYKRAVPLKESEVKAKDKQADKYQQISLFDQKISS